MLTRKEWLGVVMVLFLAMGSVAVAAQQPEFQIVTGELPPYTFTKNGKLSGFAVEIVNEAMSRVGAKQDILIEPWKRALANSRERRITFPLIRSVEREALYTWVAPLVHDGGAFVVRADDTKKYSGTDDFKSLKIGVLSGARTESILKKLGCTRIDPVATPEQNVKKLLAGRIDAWFESELVVRYTLRKMNMDAGRVIIAHRREKATMYIVASPDIPTSTVTSWRRAIDAMKADGSYQKILDKYGIGPEFIRLHE